MARHCEQHLASAHELEAGSTGLDVVWVESLLDGRRQAAWPVTTSILADGHAA